MSGAPLRVLAIHRYFWPDTPPYAAMLRTICAHWAAQGHRVEVLSSSPSYKPEALVEAPRRETVDEVRVHRLPMEPDRGGRGRKPRNMLRFSLLAAWHVLRGPRRDVVMCSTAPQVLLGWAVSLAARLRGSAFVYHCMDLHPEIGALSGEFANPLVYRVLMRLDTAACRRAAAVVVLSDDMRAALLRRDPALADRIVVLNNFDLPEYGDPVAAPVARRDDVVTIAFTGNLGRFQGLETVVDAVLGSDPALDGLRLVLMGEGAAKADLAARVAAAPADRRDRVALLPHGSTAQARALMAAADWGLVALTPRVIEFAYPSKTATYLSEGLPVLAAVEPDSSLSRDVVAWGAGRTLPLDSVEAAREALVGLAQAPDRLPAMRASAREAWSREFAVEGRLERWDALLDGLAAAAPATLDRSGRAR